MSIEFKIISCYSRPLRISSNSQINVRLLLKSIHPTVHVIL
uniref:Uncharacterized protein n=1 Tax=viral metagenome TaxID=1070528 RepID=A0A6C0BMX6_9ZZZZ